MKPSWLDVAKNELLRLVRDRRALFLAVVLPALLYPLLFVGMEKLEQVGEKTLEARELTGLVDLSGLEPDLADELRERFGNLEKLELTEADLSQLNGLPDVVRSRRARAEDIEVRNARAEAFSLQMDALAPDADLALVARAGPDGRPILWMVFDGGNVGSMEAQNRVEDTLDELAEEQRRDALIAGLGRDPAEDYRVETIDAAAPEDAAGAALGRFLPLIAVLVMVSGGAFAALDAFAAERENGTLETLLVQPVPARTLAVGKFAAVLLVAVIAWAGNAASLLGTAAAGLLPEAAGAAGGFDAQLLGRVGLGLLLFMPSAVLIAVALCLVSSRARSFREGQNYLLPVTLAGIALVAPAMSPDVELDVVLACVPLLGPSLALRDALSGNLSLLPALIAVVASLVVAALMLTRLASTLDAERLLAEAPSKASTRTPLAAVRRSQLTGGAAVLLVYLVGMRLQAWDLVPGLLISMWGIVLGLAVWLGLLHAKREGTSFVAELGLSTVNPLACLGALLLAPGLVQGMRVLLEFQGRFIPMPTAGMGDELAGLMELSVPTLLLLIAVSPGICEELLMRGSVLSGLLRGPSRVQAIAMQAGLFAIMHASVHRLAITFVLGALLGVLRLGAGTIVPCMLLHMAYNGLQLLSTTGVVAARWGELILHPGWWAAFVVGLALIWSSSVKGALLPKKS